MRDGECDYIIYLKMKIESLPIININLVAIDVCLIINPRSAS